MTGLADIAALVHRVSGIRLTERQHPFLRAALDRIDPGAGPDGFLRRVSDPTERVSLIARLIEEVTVKETSFLRDRAQLATIDWRMLLEHAHGHGSDQVRVWVAPCATGEEAYSLALLACEAFAPAPAPVSILATDISADALVRARRGIYGSRSARELEPALRARYFSQSPDGLAVGAPLRALVTFERHNLISAPFPPLGQAPFDLILCRNVLIYFGGETVGRVLASFAQALAPSGALVLGAADMLCASASGRAMARAATDPSRRAPRRTLRRPLGRTPADTPTAPRGSPDEVVTDDSRLITEDPLDAAAYFRRGLAELEGDDPAAAVNSLRRALYVEPLFGLAAFKLGGAHEALGHPTAARRAYEQALRALEPDERHEQYLAQIDLADVATAVRARLVILAAGAD